MLAFQNCLGEHLDSWLTGTVTDLCMSYKLVIIVIFYAIGPIVILTIIIALLYCSF